MWLQIVNINDMAKLCFFVNFLNIHQVHLMDEFYKLLDKEFVFVSTVPLKEKDLKGGADYSERPYCIHACETEEAHLKALKISVDADVCVFGACSEEYAINRARYAKEKLSFEMGERWLKRGLKNLFSSTLRKWYSNYFYYYRHANFYKLCNSAFVKRDDSLMRAYKGRHYKWGYFINTNPSYIEYKENISNSENPTIMWCARFLDWKHPELPILLAKKLKNVGHEIRFDLYGTGTEYDKMVSLSEALSVNDIVRFRGSVPNEEIRHQMMLHDIFIFTSDRREGWGVVLNEAMSSYCAVVASDAIGAAPFLINEGVNGLMYKSNDLNSLYEKVMFLLDNPSVRISMAENAVNDMNNTWSPQKAAENFLVLIDNLKDGNDTSIMEGPCSKA